eukprot:scaffold155945_cov40-Cyclotella_meneghiniana.AAC.4
MRMLMITMLLVAYKLRKDAESGNRESSGVLWAGTWLLGSGYSGESTMYLSGKGSPCKSSGGAGWREWQGR